MSCSVHKYNWWCVKWVWGLLKTIILHCLFMRESCERGEGEFASTNSCDFLRRRQQMNGPLWRHFVNIMSSFLKTKKWQRSTIKNEEIVRLLLAFPPLHAWAITAWSRYHCRRLKSYKMIGCRCGRKWFQMPFNNSIGSYMPFAESLSCLQFFEIPWTQLLAVFLFSLDSSSSTRLMLDLHLTTFDLHYFHNNKPLHCKSLQPLPLNNLYIYILGMHAVATALYWSLCFDYSHCLEVRTQVQLIDMRKSMHTSSSVRPL